MQNQNQNDVVYGRIANALPGCGWVQGRVVGYKDGQVLIDGEMIHISNVTQGRHTCYNVWICDPASLEYK